MKYRFLATVGCIACAALLGAACWVGAAVAQQPALKSSPPPAALTDQAGQLANIVPAGWAKLCRQYVETTTGKDGKKDNRDLNICLTKNETIYVNSGKMQSSAAIRQVNAETKLHLMATVPLEIDLRAGIRAAVFSKDLWDRTQKGAQLSKADEAKLKPLTLAFTQCHPGGCDGEVEATPQLMSELKSGAVLMLFAFNAGGAPAVFPIPLAGFDKAYTDPPIDERAYNDARRRQVLQIEQERGITGVIVLPKQLPR